MTTIVTRKFAVAVVYNGVEKPFEVEPEEKVSTLLQRAIAAFGIVQNPHLLSLFREDGTVVQETESVEQAGLKPHEVLLLRPNAVKGGDRIVLVKDVIAKTFAWLRECGRGECECVLYWTGPSEKLLVDGVEHPVHKRSPFGYELDGPWLTDFWRQLGKSQRSVKAQIHTHPGDAFHSATDDHWPIVSQVGFLSIVIPDFAAGEPTLDAAWIGRLRTDGNWEQLESAVEALALQ
jgi:hypothetical protein